MQESLVTPVNPPVRRYVEDCPVEMPLQIVESQHPVEDLPWEDMLDVGVGVEAYEGTVNDLLNGERLGPEETERSVGHVACSSCAYVERCKEAILRTEDIAPGINHPVDLIKKMDPQSYTELWSRFIQTSAEHKGYTRQSAANIYGVFKKMRDPIQTLISETLEEDSSRIPVALGNVVLGNDSYQLVDFGSVRLLISQKAAKELEGDSQYAASFMKGMQNLVSEHTHDEVTTSRLRTALKTRRLSDIHVKRIQSSKHVLEFNGGTNTTLRGFGKVIGSSPKVEDSKDTVVISEIADVKGGAQGEADRIAGNINAFIGSLDAEAIQTAVNVALEKGSVLKLQKRN